MLTCKLQQISAMLSTACFSAAQAGREADIFADAIRARDERNQQVLCDKEREAARSEQQLRRSEQQLADRATAIQRLQVQCATGASWRCTRADFVGNEQWHANRDNRCVTDSGVKMRCDICVLTVQ